ncbi:unnamed protein product, partial [marine sediment metagenome]
MHMDPRDTQHVAEFRKAAQAWTDERFLSRKELESLAMFGLYLVNLADADGWQYDGHSWKQAPGMGCLVVKATVDNIPH